MSVVIELTARSSPERESSSASGSKKLSHMLSAQMWLVLVAREAGEFTKEESFEL